MEKSEQAFFLDCAWCLAALRTELAPYGVPVKLPAEGESHGICSFHAALAYAALQERRASRMAVRVGGEPCRSA